MLGWKGDAGIGDEEVRVRWGLLIVMMFCFGLGRDGGGMGGGGCWWVLVLVGGCR